VGLTPRFTPCPARGRVYAASRTVRAADVTPSGRLRLDAFARYLQEAAEDDVAEVGWQPPYDWLLRRCAVAARGYPAAGDRVTLRTFCTGTGPRWAERTTTLAGPAGDLMQATAVWVAVGRDGAPAALGPGFHRRYGAAAGGRRVSARLTLPAPGPAAAGRPWPVRASDLDPAGHVNNAVQPPRTSWPGSAGCPPSPNWSTTGPSSAGTPRGCWPTMPPTRSCSGWWTARAGSRPGGWPGCPRGPADRPSGRRTAGRSRVVWPPRMKDSAAAAGRREHATGDRQRPGAGWPGPRDVRRRRRVELALPAAMVLAGIVSVQSGAGIADKLFGEIPPVAVTGLRLWTSAVAMALIAGRGLPRALGDLARRRAFADAGIAMSFGISLLIMNFSIYQAFARIPLGVAVTIEFLGPLAVAVAGSRHLRDVGWVALAGTGVALLTRGGHGHLDLAGVGFAGLAGACWAAYIVLSSATGRRFPGSAGLAIAMAVSAVLVTPPAVIAGGRAMLRPGVLGAGAAVGVLSSVIPYRLELETLRRMPMRLFGVWMSLEPAVAALIGLVLLGQHLSPVEWAAIGCVMVACAGAAQG